MRGETATVTSKVHFASGRTGAKKLRAGPAPEKPVVPEGRIPRVARLMALAIRFEGLLRDGVINDQAELASLGHVTRARITQIMNLNHLAPDIQEEILFLPEVVEGRDPVVERHLRPIAAVIEWDRQRAMWRRLVEAAYGPTRSIHSTHIARSDR